MNFPEQQNTLKVGMRVKLMEDGAPIADGIITSFFTGDLEFTDSDPKYKNFKKEFVFQEEYGGWKMLGVEPFTRRRFVSKHTPVYAFEPIDGD